MINTTLNGVSSGEKQHDQCCHGDKDEEEVICHSNIDEMRDDINEGMLTAVSHVIYMTTYLTTGII